MSVFDKLAFWKKKDPFDLDSVAQRDMGPSGLSHDPAMPPPGDPYGSRGYMPNTAPSYQAPVQPQTYSNPLEQHTGNSNDLALVSSKLDTLKALLDNIDRRLAALERNSQQRQQQPPRLW